MARATKEKPPAVRVASAKALRAKRQGQSFGAAFAPRNLADRDRVHSFASAIRSGIQDARNWREFERAASGDDDFLIGMGFGGRQ